MLYFERTNNNKLAEHFKKGHGFAKKLDFSILEMVINATENLSFKEDLCIYRH